MFLAELSYIYVLALIKGLDRSLGRTSGVDCEWLFHSQTNLAQSLRRAN